MESEYKRMEPKTFKEASERLKHRILPALLAGITLLILVFMLQYAKIDKAYDLVSSAVIFTSFASSIYIMFITPNARTAKSSKFVKSYIIASIVGSIGGFLIVYLPLYIVAGMVLFFVSILMIMTQSEHPPAAAIAFAFVLFKVNYTGILIIISGIIIVLAVRYVLEKTLFEVEGGISKAELIEKERRRKLRNSRKHKRKSV